MNKQANQNKPSKNAPARPVPPPPQSSFRRTPGFPQTCLSFTKEAAPFLRTIRSPSPKEKVGNLTVIPCHSGQKRSAKQGSEPRAQPSFKKLASSERGISTSFNVSKSKQSVPGSFKALNQTAQNIYMRFRRSPDALGPTKENASKLHNAPERAEARDFQSPAPASSSKELDALKRSIEELNRGLTFEAHQFKISVEQYRLAVLRSIDDIGQFLVQIRANFVDSFDKRFQPTMGFFTASLKTAARHKSMLEKLAAKSQGGESVSSEVGALLEELVMANQACSYPQFSDRGKDAVLCRIFALTEELCSPSVFFGSLKCIDSYNQTLKGIQQNLCKITKLALPARTRLGFNKQPGDAEEPKTRLNYELDKKPLAALARRPKHFLGFQPELLRGRFADVSKKPADQRSKQTETDWRTVHTASANSGPADCRAFNFAKVKQVLTIDDQEFDELCEPSETISRLTVIENPTDDDRPPAFFDNDFRAPQRELRKRQTFATYGQYSSLLWDGEDAGQQRIVQDEGLLLSPIYTVDQGYGTQEGICESFEAPSGDSGRRPRDDSRGDDLGLSLSLKCSEDLGDFHK